MHKHQQVRVSLDGIVISDIASSENLQIPPGQRPIRGLMILANYRFEDPVPSPEGNFKITANTIGECEPRVAVFRSARNKGSLDHYSESEISAIRATESCRR